MKLLSIKRHTPVVWINRTQVSTPDRERNCSWTPLWKGLGNLGNIESLVERARAFVIAGTPEWIDTVQPIYNASAKARLPVWIVGVGGGQEGQTGHLKPLCDEGLINVSTVRDGAAKGALESLGLECFRFLDPAFHGQGDAKADADLFIFNPRLKSNADVSMYLRLFQQFKQQIDVVVVHEPEEYSRACRLFDVRVFYHSDYLQYVDLYKSCVTYVGGRMHGAIPSLVAGAEVHLVCHEGKHRECVWLKEKLGSEDALTLWEASPELEIRIRKRFSRYDHTASISQDFEDHRAYLRLGVEGGNCR